MDHDHSYKLIFSHPRMMRDLLEAFVTGEWVDSLDFGTLERVSGSYVADDLRERADDIVWRVRCGEQLLYLLVEFQSRVDRFMAIRVLTYVGLLYQDLIRDPKSRDSDNLPAILPIVLHSGEMRWSAPEDISSLVSNVPRGLEEYRPQLRYLLIDEAGYVDDEPAKRRNLAALLFQLENCRHPDLVQALLVTLAESLQDPELEGLRRAFGVWLDRVVLRRLGDEQVRIVNQLWELPVMLSERFDQWEREFMERGRQEGREEGREEGRQEGLQKGIQVGVGQLLARLMQRRFGELPESVRTGLSSASAEQLETWSSVLIEAASLDDVRACIRLMRATD
jgi:predicted transposase YdaD